MKIVISFLKNKKLIDLEFNLNKAYIEIRVKIQTFRNKLLFIVEPLRLLIMLNFKFYMLQEISRAMFYKTDP